MRIIVIGAGAMGSLYGGYLSQGKDDICLIDQWEKHIDKINAKGLVIMSDKDSFTVRPMAKNAAERCEPADLVIITVKSNETEMAAILAGPLMKPGTKVLTLQNGMGNAEHLAEALGSDRVVVGTTLMGAVLLEPGLVMHADIKATQIASWAGGDEQSLKEIAQVFNRAGLPTTIENNVNSLLWSKLSIHAGLNAVTALTGATNREFLALPEATRLARMIVAEVVAVATAAEIPLLYSNCAHEMMAYAETMKEYHSPMLQDVLNKRQTEASVLNCAVVKEGRHLGIPTPVNAAVALAINAIEHLYVKK